MSKIDKNTLLKELALIVCDKFRRHGIDAVLTGGAVVSIYSQNRYQSYDLDFITHCSVVRISIALKEIGFEKHGRYYKNPDTDYFIEFPPPPVAVGNKPLTKFNEIKTESGYLKLLTPTQCVMDRLAAFYHWNDRPSLEQAVLVAKNNEIDFEEIKIWSKEEDSMKKFEVFLESLRKEQSA
ncbi:MAG TPA: hypothetical protein PK560_01745 [bacterium]|nr:hypothetical protein [bacterium]